MPRIVLIYTHTTKLIQHAALLAPSTRKFLKSALSKVFISTMNSGIKQMNRHVPEAASIREWSNVYCIQYWMNSGRVITNSMES